MLPDEYNLSRSPALRKRATKHVGRVSVSGMCTCVHMCAVDTPVHSHAEATCLEETPVFLHCSALFSWDKVSYWTWSSLIGLSWIVSKLLGSSCLCLLPTPMWGLQTWAAMPGFFYIYRDPGDSNIGLHSRMVSTATCWAIFSAAEGIFKQKKKKSHMKT